MKLYSEILSNVLKILLWALVGLAAINLLNTIVYAIDVDLYIDYAYSLDGFVEISSTVLYYIILVIFLIWIYRVHMDLMTLFPLYTRTPGMALACVMVPIFNFYGIPSNYYRMGQQLQAVPAANKQGKYIAALSVPLIVLILVMNGLNRMFKADAEPSTTLLIVNSALLLINYSVYLALCIQVSSGLKQASIHKPAAAPELDPPDADWVSSSLTKDTSASQKA